MAKKVPKDGFRCMACNIWTPGRNEVWWPSWQKRNEEFVADGVCPDCFKGMVQMFNKDNLNMTLFFVPKRDDEAPRPRQRGKRVGDGGQ